MAEPQGHLLPVEPSDDFANAIEAPCAQLATVAAAAVAAWFAGPSAMSDGRQRAPSQLVRLGA